MDGTLKEIWETKGTLKPEGWEILKGKAYKRIDGSFDGYVGDAVITEVMLFPSDTGVKYECNFASTDGNDYHIAIDPQPDNIVDAMMIADKQLAEEGIA